MKLSQSSLLDRALPVGTLRWEGTFVAVAAWAFLVAIPLSLGELGLGSDALNHHIYLGWTAEHHRFDRDFLAAGYQSTEWPYLFWPVYRMAVAGWSGAAAGAVLASLHLVVVWPVWMLARACIPGRAAFDVALRVLAVALALASGLVLSVLDSTIIDVLAAAPLVWAIALAMEPIAHGPAMTFAAARRYVMLSGLCAGLAVAFKLSNGPLAVCLPALWVLCTPGWRDRIVAVVLGSLCTLAAFGAAYGYWGWLLWRTFGNPVYPFLDGWFAPLRAALDRMG